MREGCGRYDEVSDGTRVRVRRDRSSSERIDESAVRRNERHSQLLRHSGKLAVVGYAARFVGELQDRSHRVKLHGRISRSAPSCCSHVSGRTRDALVGGQSRAFMLVRGDDASAFRRDRTVLSARQPENVFESYSVPFRNRPRFTISPLSRDLSPQEQLSTGTSMFASAPRLVGSGRRC